MTITLPPLSRYLAEISDVRHAKGLRHPLLAILQLCCVAMLAGARLPNNIATWWDNRRDQPGLLERLGFRRGYGPSKSTLYRVLSQVLVAELERQLCRWIEDCLAQMLPDATALEAVAVDGKKQRGSQRQGAEVAYLLSALSQRLGVTLGQVAIPLATNEIGAMPDLLVSLVIEGRVFTMDALHTQRDTAQTLVDNHGDYVMLVKENQFQLHDAIALLFNNPDTALFVEGQAASTGKAHGRLETRTLQTSSALNDYLDWPGLQQIFRLDRKTIRLNTGEVSTETVYGLTSLSAQRADADALLTLTRGQWSIENRCHWVRDVTFGEDQSQVRKGQLPHVMAALRNTVISLLRLLHPARFIPDALDFFAAHPLEALAAIGC